MIKSNNMKNILLLLAFAVAFISCNSSDDDDGLFLTKAKEQGKADSLAKVSIVKK